jgi:hypothetical protein
MQKNKHYFNGPSWARGLPAIALAAFVLFTACSQGDDDDDSPSTAPALLHVKNHLVIASGDEEATASETYLEFVFDKGVSGPAVSVVIGEATEADAADRWAASLKEGPEEGEVIDTIVKVTYTAPTEAGTTSVEAGDKLAITLVASGTSYSVTLKAVDQTFDRSTIPESAGGYTIKEWYPLGATVGLVKATTDVGDDEETADGTVLWVALDSESDDQAALIKTFGAILGPNSSGTEKTVETGKKAITFDDEISAKVIALFKVKFGAESAPVDTVDISGTDLPDVESASATNLIVVDIGLPDADNSDLPRFYIPYAKLGSSTLEEGQDYSHIRLRVNKGAYLVINGLEVTESIPTGYFKGGAIETLAGGYLRDGAFQGFPLGADAVILNRYGSSLAIGPEPEKVPTGYEPTYNKYFSGWLLGPVSGDPKIVWDAEGNSAGSYLEVRPGLIATNAKLTLKRSLGLIYSVWFVDNAALTLDAANEGTGPYGDLSPTFHGLTVSSGNRKFYGTTKTTITIKPGNKLEQYYLSSEEGDYTDIALDSPTGWVKPAGREPLVITNRGTASATEEGEEVQPTYYVSDDSGISGYLNWDLGLTGEDEEEEGA